jgi:DNA modification methylase
VIYKRKEIIGKATLYLGDCMEVMPLLDKVDAVVTDPPYGTTSCSWDNIIPFNLMWKNIKKITKKNSPILIFGQEPFSSFLRCSNIENYKYDMYWKKQKPTNFLMLNKRHGKVMETISLFSYGSNLYNSQKVKVFGKTGYQERNIKNKKNLSKNNESLHFQKRDDSLIHPSQVLEFNREEKNIHPTQKPVSLLSHLVASFTDSNQSILDFTMGSGSTGVAAVQMGREFIGIELDEEYFNIACKRIEDAQRQGDMFVD